MRFGELAISEQGFGQMKLHVLILRAVGKRVAKILQGFGGLPGRQILISLLIPFRDQPFLPGVVRLGQRRGDGKQHCQQDQAEQQRPPLYISRYDILRKNGHDTKITQPGREAYGFLSGRVSACQLLISMLQKGADRHRPYKNKPRGPGSGRKSSEMYIHCEV